MVNAGRLGAARGGARDSISDLPKQLGADVAGVVDHGADFDVVGLRRIKDVVGLEAEATVALGQLVGALPDIRKIGQQTKCADQPRVLCLRLIGSKLAGRVAVYLDKVCACAVRNPIAASHAVLPQPARGPPRESPQAFLD